MQAAEIRERFLKFFERNAHRALPSASLVPAEDPTLLFTNAGMVPFKKMFLGIEEPVPGRRATTSQKCVRAGGKHNDLEQVGHTARHHTFFEMLGNFSFGDYFKREAIRLAWEFLTGPRKNGGLSLDPAFIRVTVFDEDSEARALWQEVAGLAPSRIYGLGEKDNFWQMAETGPCGPCSEIYVDLAHVTDDWTLPAGAAGEWTERHRKEFSHGAFVEGAEAGRFLEVWNLVFMQYDRQPDGSLMPLPKPSVDTGLGLERVAAVMQRKANNFHTDLFRPLLDVVGDTVGTPYDEKREDFERKVVPRRSAGAGGRATRPRSQGTGSFASYRVLADHARAVAFLLADGVFPSNEGRGYVLRRILRRAARHAWLLGRTEPTLFAVVERVIELMGGVYPELQRRARHIVTTTRAEEERFLATIEGGMRRFEQLAPLSSTQGSATLRGTISGEHAFRLYDTFGFPLDLTELMARERGYTVDVEGFEQALAAQRSQSQEERRGRKVAMSSDATWSAEQDAWETSRAPLRIGARTAEYETPAAAERGGRARTSELPAIDFVGYNTVEAETEVVAIRRGLPGERTALVVLQTPFYAESGGQVSDVGEIVGEGWRLDVDEVRKVDGRIATIGKLTGTFHFGRAVARVPRDTRLDTERNHTATHLLHAALREVLGEHVHQAGSLVAPDRLRFDFTHHGALTPEQVARVEDIVNRGIFAAEPVRFEEKSYAEATAAGAMALFGEKYGDVVRVVSISGRSVELCGGTHVRNTSEIGLFRITSEKGIAAGVRRIEALTGPRAYEWMRELERALERIGTMVGAPPSAAAKRVQSLLEERKSRDKREAGAARADESTTARALAGRAQQVNGTSVVTASVDVPDVKSLQALGDAMRAELGSGVAVLAASLDGGKHTILLVVTDDLRDRGIRADHLIREIAAVAGGRGGGKPHMAQAGVTDGARIPEILAKVPGILEPHLRASA